MSSKTIEINPSLFSVGGLSKKNKSKKNKPMVTPLISPNILKNKLLKRIKDHKNKETENLENNKKKISSKSEDTLIQGPTSSNINSYTDEFNDSIEYLQTLSKQKKTETENTAKRNAIQRKTVKNYSTMPVVNLELPDELKETFVSEPIITNISRPVLIKNNQVDLPYGILKGGSKPTYRQWNKTQKNYQPVINTQTVNAPVSERESRLNILKQKLKQQSTIINSPIQQQVQIITPQVITPEPNFLQPIQIVPEPNLEEILLTQNLIQKPKEVIINSQNNNISSAPVINEAIVGQSSNLGNRTIKKLLKKTIHKKYTLGKSKIKKTVGILLKDKNTRKNVLNAQKDLRNKSTNDVKTYLREHNLIKIGSNAPNDVIRKIYESAMLAGEITNNNKDTMIHNFIKDDT